MVLLKQETVRYNKNPFIDELSVTTKNKQVKISALGRDNNILINQETGEVSGTHIVTYKKYDESRFVKIFPAMVGAQFDLTSSGIKAFSVLIWAAQEQAIGKDLVCLDKYALEDFKDAHTDLRVSLSTIRKGLVDLENAKFIAKAQRKGHYYINPSLLFNGDRVAFTTVIERTSEQTHID